MRNKDSKIMSSESDKQKKLSLFRVSIAILVIAGIIYASFFGTQWWKSNQVMGSSKAWFASYVDVTATPTFPFQQLGTTSNRDAILAFIVSLNSNACTPSWGNAYTINQASSSLDLDTRIARLQQQGGSVAISFGGRINNELAIKCTDPDKLLAAYQSVVNHYNIDTIDLDLEGASLTNIDSQIRRATAIKQLQTKRRHQGKKLAVWLTLPVDPEGFTSDGTNAISTFLSKGVDLSGVNLMTMDYGSSLVSGMNMLTGSESALNHAQHQLGVLYKRNRIYLNDATLWSKMGITPMIGQNDDQNEIFTLEDAKNLNLFALSKKISRISMWSANRDAECGSNYINVKIVSDACSGITEDKGNFSKLLGYGFDGSISLSAGLVTTSGIPTSTIADNAATSPYQIWTPTGSYIAGTKVVWHHSIYQAKWWTQGDIPDNPVLQSWQTTWDLIGPVLPGQTPIPQPTLPAGIYPNWSGTQTYNAGQRVLLNGVPYQAKWWNQGDSPDASISEPNGSPWVQLTQTQINEILPK